MRIVQTQALHGMRFFSDDGLIEITVHDDSADAIPTMCVQERYWDMVFSTIDNTKKCEINIAVMY